MAKAAPSKCEAGNKKTTMVQTASEVVENNAVLRTARRIVVMVVGGTAYGFKLG